jgi:pimeloyl-ACP methyl ester carboxylesterase
MPAPPEVRYARSGDLSIAWFEHGEGPLDIVYVPGFISNADLVWEMPVYRYAIERMATFGRVITFDKRGTGLSDRSLGHGSVAERMDDIRAVMDAAGSERAALVGRSEGGPLTILFAATYPERVSALVLWNTYARGLRGPDYPIGLDPDVTKEFIAAVGNGWGKGLGLAAFFGIPHDEELRSRFARFERNAATPKTAAEILTANVEIDVRSALPAVSAPTLVMHRRHDPVIPFRLGKFVADGIPGARLVELPGAFHASQEDGGDDDAVAQIEEFLTGRRSERPAVIDRVLATVLFVDIVDSTRMLSELGDLKWRELLDAFRAALRRELERFRGREVNTRGDDILATFDGPARAISCAQAIGASARPLGIEVRAGLHTGEVELQGDDIAGIAVHIGARVAALAGAGDVLVTSTVRDLVAGSGLEFAERGTHELKGVPGEWTILEAIP